MFAARSKTSLKRRGNPMQRIVILGSAMAGFGLLTVTAPAGAQPAPPTLVCDENNSCNIIERTVYNYAKLPGDAVNNWARLPGQTIENYRNLIPDAIENWTGVDIRKPPPTSGGGNGGGTGTGGGTGSGDGGESGGGGGTGSSGEGGGTGSE
jgi:uncharacterized membrane protein YgcG